MHRFLELYKLMINQVNFMGCSNRNWCKHLLYSAGCVDLLHTIQTRVKPKYHVFGHIHEGLYFIHHIFHQYLTNI